MWNMDNALIAPETDLADAKIDAREAEWWYLLPGEEGFGTPLWSWLGFPSEHTWRQYLEARMQRRSWRVV